MATIKEKTIEAVAKMVILTQDHDLIWEEVNVDELPISLDEEDAKMEQAFEAEFNNKKLRLYKYKYYFRYPDELWTALRALKPQKKEGEWKSQVVLEIVGINNKGLWSFPNVNILNDLFLFVQYQVAGVKELFNELLEEKIT